MLCSDLSVLNCRYGHREGLSAGRFVDDANPASSYVTQLNWFECKELSWLVDTLVSSSNTKDN